MAQTPKPSALPTVPPTSQPSALPIVPPQDHMAREIPQKVPDYVQAELDYGKKATDEWEKRREEELTLGKQLSNSQSK